MVQGVVTVTQEDAALALKADHSSLPSGNPPTPNPRYGHLLAEAWRDANVETDKAFAVDGARLRASWAGGCSRELGYRIMGVVPSDPPGLSAYWRMGLGTMVHEHLQGVLAAAFPGAEIERIVDWRENVGLPGASHVDAYLVTRGEPFTTPECEAAGRHIGACPCVGGLYRKTVIEIKSVNGFKFKLMVGSRGPAQGPTMGHLLQAAISARALGADEVTMIYLSLECLSQHEADKIGTDETGKFLAEWTYPMSALDEMVDREVARLGKVLELVDTDVLPPRHMPGEMPPGARVQDPLSGAWTLERGGLVLEAGSLWKCSAYCEMRDRCVQDGPS